MTHPTHPQQVVHESYYIDEGMDLRAYISIILNNWHLIIACTVVAALSAAFFSFSQVPSYEATTLVAAVTPHYTIRIDENSQAPAEVNLARQVFLAVATSDELLQQLLDNEALKASLPADTSLAGLQSMVSANNFRNDPSLLELKVSSNDPQQAAAIANSWATLFVAEVNQLYSESDHKVSVLETQLKEVATHRQSAEEALIAFQSSNDAAMLRARLESLQTTYSQYLAQQQQIAPISQDLEGFRAQLAAQPSDAPVALSDELTAILLQLTALNAEASSDLFQINGNESRSSKTVGELLASVEQLASIVQAKPAHIESQLAQLDTEILDTQRILQKTKSEQTRLTQSLEIAQQTYISLARKVEEARIASQVSTGEVKLASLAAVPSRPVGPRTLTNIALAAIVGLMVGLGMAFLIEYWEQTAPLPAREIPMAQDPAAQKKVVGVPSGTLVAHHLNGSHTPMPATHNPPAPPLDQEASANVVGKAIINFYPNGTAPEPAQVPHYPQHVAAVLGNSIVSQHLNGTNGAHGAHGANGANGANGTAKLT